MPRYILPTTINNVRITKDVPSLAKERIVEYICPSCGITATKALTSIIRGFTVCVTCGNKKSAIKRTKFNSIDEKRLSTIYHSMKQRCYNTNSKDYKYYGMKGITICEEWLNDIELFISWSLSNGYKKGMSIDRKHVDDMYSPSTCRWVTMKVQAQNTRLLSKNNTSGYRGVYIVGNTIIAKITSNGESHYLGSFKTLEEAAVAYNTFIILNNTKHPLNIIKEPHE